jgi:hypothetical protein
MRAIRLSDRHWRYTKIETTARQLVNYDWSLNQLQLSNVPGGSEGDYQCFENEAQPWSALEPHSKSSYCLDVLCLAALQLDAAIVPSHGSRV